MIKGILLPLHIGPVNARCTSTNDCCHNILQVHGFCHKPKILCSISFKREQTVNNCLDLVAHFRCVSLFADTLIYIFFCNYVDTMATTYPG